MDAVAILILDLCELKNLFVKCIIIRYIHHLNFIENPSPLSHLRMPLVPRQHAQRICNGRHKSSYGIPT